MTAENAAWTAFWSLLIVAAGCGVVGGAMKREPSIADADVRGRGGSEPYPGEVASIRLGADTHRAGPIVRTDTTSARR